VRRSESGWEAACEDRRAVSDHLGDAIRDAVGSDRGEGLLMGLESNAATEQWIRETAAHIVGDTLH
jgi:hypothetical protein